MRRQLGGFESAQAWTGASSAYNAVAVLRLGGRPRRAPLEAALAAVQRRQPLLRARLVREGGRWLFESAAGAVPLRRIERRGEEHWCEVVEEELDRPFETGTAPLARCALLSPTGEAASREGSASAAVASEIVLAFHHAIADATSGALVCRRLLERLAVADGGSAGGGGPRAADGAGLPAAEERPPGEVGALPPPPETRFPARFQGLRRYPPLAAFLARQLAAEVGYLWRSRGVRCAVPDGPARCRVLPVALGEAATVALVRRCRRERVPLNGAVNAALLLAVQRRRYGGRAVPLRYFAFPDLRPYLEPPVGLEPLASYLTTMRFTIDLGAGEQFWELARRVENHLLASFRRGEKFLFCMTSAALLRMVLGIGRVRFGSAAVSYTGPLEFPPAFGGLRVRGLHAFVSNMPVGPEVTAQARLFRGRLWWDFVTLDVDMDRAEAAEIAGDILARLEAAGA